MFSRVLAASDLTECGWLTRDAASAHLIYSAQAGFGAGRIKRLAGIGGEPFIIGTPRQSQVLALRRTNVVVILQYYQHDVGSRPIVSLPRLARRIAARLR